MGNSFFQRKNPETGEKESEIPPPEQPKDEEINHSIITIFPKERIEEGETVTNDDCRKAANRAFLYSILSWIFPILLIEVVRDIKKADRSFDPEIKEKVSIARRIALTLGGIMALGFLFMPYLFFIETGIVSSLLVGNGVMLGIISVLWFRKKGEWTRKKLWEATVILGIYAILASLYTFALIYN